MKNITATVAVTSETDPGIMATLHSVSHALSNMSGLNGVLSKHETGARLTFENVDATDFAVARGVLLKFGQERGWKIIVEVKHA